MSSYENVKRFRKKIKESLLNSFNNKCAICSYDKCDNALEFHHLDPKTKEFAISRWTLLNSEKIKEEAKKCILVCCRCHREIHSGDVILTEKEYKFNESKFNSFWEKETFIDTPCLKCGKLKSWKLKYCSQKCACKGKQKVNWEQIDLKKELETKTINRIAKELNISFNAVKKRFNKLQ